jgi:phosphatidylglycerol---prolipoprotein diacylglyceryl transferase
LLCASLSLFVAGPLAAFPRSTLPTTGGRLSAVHEIAFKLGGLTVHWYGILVAAGFMAGYWTAQRRGLRDGLSPDAVADVVFWLFLGGIVGARVLFVITYWREEFADQPLSHIITTRSGFVFYGGLIGATICGIAYARWKQLPVWKLADALVPSVALGHAFGRLGCLMTGCCHGRACDLPWAVHFPVEHPTHGAGVHPTQLYEAGLNLALYGALAWWYRRKRFDGQVFALYLMAYAPVRALVEHFRGDYAPAKFVGPLSPGQLVSVGIFAAGLVFYFMLRRRTADAKPETPNSKPV